jgi:hypothetical protein
MCCCITLVSSELSSLAPTPMDNDSIDAALSLNSTEGFLVFQANGSCCLEPNRESLKG